MTIRPADEIESDRERTMARTFWRLGCIFAFLGVAAGAFGAHALRARVPPDLLAVFETAARYQMYHALALLAVALAAARTPSGAIRAAGWLFTAGIVVFSGEPVRAGAERRARAGRHHPHRRGVLPGGMDRAGDRRRGTAGRAAGVLILRLQRPSPRPGG